LTKGELLLLLGAHSLYSRSRLLPVGAGSHDTQLSIQL
jgi:hypothetical protein